MAGDWIKMELVTPDKPEMHRMADILGISTEQVLGGMVRVWIWADTQSLDGHALTVTETTLNRVSCVPNIATAMRQVGWLVGENGCLSLPNFDRHNGKTAKERALATKRKRAERSRDERDKNVTREEKRRDTPIVPKGDDESARQFGRFWSAYPRRVAKQDALKAWKALRLPVEQFDRLMASLEVAKVSPDWQRDAGRFIPYPATWLNGKRWEDEAPQPVKQAWHP